MTFENQFPSLKDSKEYGWVKFIEDAEILSASFTPTGIGVDLDIKKERWVKDIEPTYRQEDLQKHCLDKIRVKEAIEKQQKLCEEQGEDNSYDCLLQELGLE